MMAGKCSLTQCRVKLMIDAEHTWYQPALDAFTLMLSEEFNKPPPTGTDWKGPLILYVQTHRLILASPEPH